MKRNLSYLYYAARLSIDDFGRGAATPDLAGWLQLHYRYSRPQARRLARILSGWLFSGYVPAARPQDLAPVYRPAAGQVPNPLACLIGCKKHGDSVWGLCDCKTRYYCVIYAAQGGEEWTHERREDFTTYAGAATWGLRESDRLNRRSSSHESQ
jgi:hypothetical protein